MAERAWLKPYHFKKGQSGNAGGKKKSAFKRVTDDAFIPFVDALLKPGGGLEELYNSPERNDFDKTIIETWSTIGRTGNIQGLREILDRIMGKPKERVDSKPAPDTVTLSELSDDELMRRQGLIDEAGE